jgi:hypothetical protein
MLHNIDNYSVENSVSIPLVWSNGDYDSGDKITAIILMLNTLWRLWQWPLCSYNSNHCYNGDCVRHFKYGSISDGCGDADDNRRYGDMMMINYRTVGSKWHCA